MPRMTLQLRLVLGVLLAEPAAEHYGLEIVTATGLLPGTVYPLLARLEEAGWVESRWEEVDPRAAGRPRRRYYRLARDPLAAAAAGEAVRAAERRAAPRGGRVAANPGRTAW